MRRPIGYQINPPTVVPYNIRGNFRELTNVQQSNQTCFFVREAAPAAGA